MIRLRNENKLLSPKVKRKDIPVKESFTLDNQYKIDVYEISAPEKFEAENFENPTLIFTFSGSVRMNISDKGQFDFLPKHLAILSARDSVDMDFPNASESEPTIFFVLTIDQKFLDRTINYFRKFQELREKNVWVVNEFQNLIYQNKKISQNLSRLLDEHLESSNPNTVMLRFALIELILRLMQTEARELIYSIYNQIGDDDRLLKLTNHFKADFTSIYKVDDLANILHLSKSQLFRVFKNDLAMSPTHYMNSIRILHAQELLTTTRTKVTDISIQCGFSDIYYFSRFFKEWVGMSPTEYRGKCIEI